MTKNPEDNAGNGFDQPDTKTLREKVCDGLKAELPKKLPEGAPLTDTGNGTQQRIPQ